MARIDSCEAARRSRVLASTLRVGQRPVSAPTISPSSVAGGSGFHRGPRPNWAGVRPRCPSSAKYPRQLSSTVSGFSRYCAYRDSTKAVSIPPRKEVASRTSLEERFPSVGWLVIFSDFDQGCVGADTVLWKWLDASQHSTRLAPGCRGFNVFRS